VKQLIHNGVLVPRYEWKRLHISVGGRRIDLSPGQEEMAVAWVRKLGTDYAGDRVFVRNFFRDFCRALGVDEKTPPEDFDFSAVQEYVQRERNRTLALSREEKKRLAELRRAAREAQRERFGYAIVDGVRMELGNYVVEPSCIFMGRGKHPLRGRWKQGPAEGDIILNLSPDAPVPEGNWKAVVRQPDAMWIAQWRDRLGGRMKYVWLSESSTLKQMADIKKFDTARELESRIDDVRRHIWESLQSPDALRRKIATVCYLIDVLKVRVGDEKDRDELDTVGATTLRPSHVQIGPEGLATFDFLGKDAVRWRKEVRLPGLVAENLQESMSEAQSSIFNGVRSKNVSLFLDEAMPGLTAKVFRTYHASKTVREFLRGAEVSPSDPGYAKKHVATMANLQAAIVCNHKKKPRKGWRESLARRMDQLQRLRSKKGTKRNREAVKKLQLTIQAMRATRDYNLGSSLKSYIDPRTYYEWGRRVDYDWKLYYPKTLQRKFSWVEPQGAEGT